MQLQELEAVVQKHMILKDSQIIKLLAAYVIAARLPIRAPWLLLVSASSGGKSMLLESLQKCSLIKVLDDLSPKALASGMRGPDGKNNSLLNEMKSGTTLIIKDFTTLLSKNKDE